VSPVFAWPTYREPWTLTVEDPMVDGQYREELVDDEHRRLRIDQVEDWRQVLLDVRAVPPSDDLRPDRVHLLVESRRSNTRMSFPLDGEGPYGTSAELRREYLAGPVTLVVEATGIVDGRVRLLGRSEEWTLVVDAGQAPTPPGAPPFTMTWVDFRSAEAPPAARRNPDAHSIMDLSGEPCLYLNDGIEGFRSLLHADTARLERRRARDLLAGEVARTAWTALVRAAVADIGSADSGDDVSAPEDQLLRHALEAVARVASGVSDLDDLVERIAAAQDGSGADGAALWTDIDAAVDRLSGLPDVVESLIRESRNV